jgi:hypothetical protein
LPVINQVRVGAFTSELFWETRFIARSLHIGRQGEETVTFACGGYFGSRLTCHPEAGEARRRTSQLETRHPRYGNRNLQLRGSSVAAAISAPRPDQYPN